MGERVLLVGAGRMGAAMATGWAGQEKKLNLSVLDPAPSKTVKALVKTEGWKINPNAIGQQPFDVLVLAVKPQVFCDVWDGDVQLLCGPDTLVVSVMAGITQARIAALTGALRVARAMPNTPGQLGLGVTALYGGPKLSLPDMALVRQMLSPLGTVVDVASEAELDLASAISGSGPAYVFLLAEVLAAVAEQQGLPEDKAKLLAHQTIIGAARLMEDGTDPAELRRAVTSPGGTTAAALDVLAGGGGGGLMTLFKAAVEAAKSRAEQLARAD